MTQNWALSQNKWALALACVFVAALGLRLWGINFGLPYLYHPDEGALVMPAINILRTGDFRPARLDYGSAYIYSLTALYIPYFLYGAWRGLFHVVSDLPVFLDYHLIDHYPFPVFYLIARAWTALLGSLTIFPAYTLGKRLDSQRAGLAAAVFCALAPFGIQNSHFATTEVPMTLLVMLAIERTVRVYDFGDWHDYVWAGFWVGLAASTKYPAMIAGGALLTAHVLRALRAQEWFNDRMALGLLAIAGGFLLGTPFALDLPYFLNWVAYVLGGYGGGQAMPALESSPIFYLKTLFLGPAAPIAVLGLLGIAWLWRKNWRRAAVLSAFPALYAALIVVQHKHYPRWLVSLEPVLAVGAGLLVAVVARRLAGQSNRFQPQWRTVLQVIVGLILIVPLASSLPWDYRLAGPDVRTEARVWVDANIPTDALVAADPMGPPLAGTRAVYLTWGLADHDPAWYIAQKVQYLVISEPVVTDSNLTPQAAASYQTLRQTFPLVKTFEGAIVGIEHQHIWVYRIAP